jgi:hypothetical protein
VKITQSVSTGTAFLVQQWRSPQLTRLDCSQSSMEPGKIKTGETERNWVVLPPNMDHEQSGRRPAVIVQDECR